MRKIILSLALIALFVSYVIWGDERFAALTARPISPVPEPKEGGPKGLKIVYTDGIYTGALADAYYGDLQVRATIQNGAITEVEFLDYPNHSQTSEFLNGRALPLLRTEAITTQTAEVDIVSGATQTSQAFQTSLAHALAAAK